MGLGSLAELSYVSHRDNTSPFDVQELDSVNFLLHLCELLALCEDHIATTDNIIIFTIDNPILCSKDRHVFKPGRQEDMLAKPV